MQEESNVHMRDSLSKHAGKKEKMVIVNHDNVTRLVDLEDAVGELLVHPIVICPGYTLCQAICWLMLLVMEQCVEFMLGIASPSGLVFQADCTICVSVAVIAQPDRHCSTIFVMGKLPL